MQWSLRPLLPRPALLAQLPATPRVPADHPQLTARLEAAASVDAPDLHDGRARNRHETTLWHAGEASAGRDRFRALSKAAQVALLAFRRTL